MTATFENMFMISDMATKWKLDSRKLILYAAEGKLRLMTQQRVTPPQTGPDLSWGTDALDLADFKWIPVDKKVFRDMCTRGTGRFIERFCPLDDAGKILAPRRIAFAELMIKKEDKLQFESEFLTKEVSTPTNKGKHWSDFREAILSAGLQVIQEELRRPGSVVFKEIKGERKIVATKLAELVHKNREQWEMLKTEKQGVTLDNMVKTFQGAFSMK